jgi:lysozyme
VDQAVNFALMAAELRRDEGTQRNRAGRHVVYTDTVGKRTVGYGRNLDDRGLSDGEADYLLQNDIAEHWAELVKALPWLAREDEVRQRAALNLAFNLGVAKLLEFRQALAAWKAGSHRAAGALLLQSRYAQQVGRRADRVARMIADGVSAD